MTKELISSIVCFGIEIVHLIIALAIFKRQKHTDGCNKKETVKKIWETLPLEIEKAKLQFPEWTDSEIMWYVTTKIKTAFETAECTCKSNKIEEKVKEALKNESKENGQEG